MMKSGEHVCNLVQIKTFTTTITVFPGLQQVVRSFWAIGEFDEPALPYTRGNGILPRAVAISSPEKFLKLRYKIVNALCKVITFFQGPFNVIIDNRLVIILILKHLLLSKKIQILLTNKVLGSSRSYKTSFADLAKWTVS